jgi:hypothetical protein
MQLAMTTKSDGSFHAIIYGVFERPREIGRQGSIIAITSSNPREGVTYVARELLAEIEEYSTSRCMLLELELLKLQEDQSYASSKRSSEDRQKRWNSSPQYRKEAIENLRSTRANVVIDCPSLASSRDVLTVAALVDGVLLVVEANRTRKEQILHAERQIIGAGGRLIGHILNKRSYDIPRWLYDII